MSHLDLPMSDEQMERIATILPTPFYLYDEKAIIQNAKNFVEAFSWAPNFKNYYAVKACPTPGVLQPLFDLGFGADCSSLPELMLSEQGGVSGENIMMTSNDTPPEEFIKAYRLGAIINLDDISHIKSMEDAIGCVPDTICFRYNPGPERTGNAIIGNPIEAKYGLTTDQLFEAYTIMKKKGCKKFGLHTMVASNELNPDYIIETAHMLFSLCVKIKEVCGVDISFVDLGGGVGIPYKVDDKEMDIAYISDGIKKLYHSIIVPAGLDPLSIAFELGRYITGPYGYLVSTVRHVTRKYKDYVGMDATMADLMRPALYGAYHHISVVGKEQLPHDHIYDVTGSLCENNDKFAIDRHLPKIEEGDILVFHDTGAHGHSMGFNYNAKLRPAEYVLKENGKVEMIRRAQTIQDYFETLHFDPVEV